VSRYRALADPAASSTASMASALLGEAATHAAEAHRHLVAALLRLERAEAEITDIDALIAEVGIDPVDWRALISGVDRFAENLLRIADAYGHREVRGRFRPQRAA